MRTVNPASGDTNFSVLEEWVSAVEAMGFNATLDWPFAPLAEDLHRIRPSAKVLLNSREDVDQWAAAFASLAEVAMLYLSFPWTKLLNWTAFSHLTARSDFCGPRKAVGYREEIPRMPWVDHLLLDKSRLSADCVRFYHAYHDRVRRLMAKSPPEQFMEFDVQSGWGPLCDWLAQGDSCPSGPLPTFDDAETLEVVGNIAKGVLYGWAPAYVVTMACACVFFMRIAAKMSCGTGAVGKSKLL